MRTEENFSSFVSLELNKLLKDTELEVMEGKNILTDVTCIFEKGKFQLMHGFAQTDIAIYEEIRFDNNKGNSDLIKFYGDKEVHKGILAIPYVVLELKTGDLTTDAIRCRDFVAARIRSMFPFTAYYFIAENTKKEEKTLLRQGKSFTNYFIFKEQMSQKEFKPIYDS